MYEDSPVADYIGKKKCSCHFIIFCWGIEALNNVKQCFITSE